MIQTGIESGSSYTFRVRARNKWGYGPYSDWVSIEASTNPDVQVTAPVTQNSGTNILISWPKPEDKGSPILEYQIVIQTSDGLTFVEESNHCDGSDASIVEARSCFIPLSVLRQAPFNLDYPDLVFAKVRSMNINGWSELSDVNTDGAKILTEPATMAQPTRGELTDQNHVHVVW